MPARSAQITRKTKETDIKLCLDLAGGSYTNKTGVGFLDHMLDHVARHGRLGLSIQATGDTHIDDHHTVEDVGIVLGQALDQALGDKKGINRYGFASVPMDDALARVSIDLSGRFALVFAVNSPAFRSSDAPPATPVPLAPQPKGPPAGGTCSGGKIGTFDTQLVEEFLRALALNAKCNLHVEVPHGHNYHHIAEAIFNALGLALKQAVAITGTDVPSTKGTL